MLKVLIVDDSLIMRRNIKKYLTSLGHNIIGEAKNANEALDFCKENKPNLITMDISMPGMNGLEVINKIKNISQYFSIIMITSYGNNSFVKSALQEGAQGYILKPVTAEKLYESISKIYPEYLKDEDLENLDE